MYLRCDRTFIENPDKFVEALASCGVQCHAASRDRIDAQLDGQSIFFRIYHRRFVACLEVYDAETDVPLVYFSPPERAEMIVSADLKLAADGKFDLALAPAGLRDALKSVDIADRLLVLIATLKWEVINNELEAEIAYVESHFATNTIAQAIVDDIRSHYAAMKSAFASQPMQFCAGWDSFERCRDLLYELYDACTT